MSNCSLMVSLAGPLLCSLCTNKQIEHDEICFVDHVVEAGAADKLVSGLVYRTANWLKSWCTHLPFGAWLQFQDSDFWSSTTRSHGIISNHQLSRKLQRFVRDSRAWVHTPSADHHEYSMIKSSPPSTEERKRWQLSLDQSLT